MGKLFMRLGFWSDGRRLRGICTRLKNAESHTVANNAADSVRNCDACGNVFSMAGGSWTGAFGDAGGFGYRVRAYGESHFPKNRDRQITTESSLGPPEIPDY
jgi:tRNA G26 N,N-dimethylase Trm1